ncbi:MAG TPA: sulfurtransferase TusA family protein [Ramlibacter sp.]|uniref:sulfurtransferase TusA family protein n=1 Tax=Ramlibacter sp. TaxID=1917967 RepID=UPI002ED008F4
MSRPSKDEREAQELDARGLGSPRSVLRAHRTLSGMQPGQSLKVLTSEVHTLAEFQSLVKHVPGYELLSQEQVGSDYVHLLVRRR